MRTSQVVRNRSLFLLLIIVLAVVLVLPALGQTGNTTIVLVPQDTNANLNEQFTVIVQIQAPVDQEVNAAEAHIDFDPAVLQIVDWTISDEFNQQFAFSGYDNAAGTLDVYVGNIPNTNPPNPNPTGTIDLVEIVFQAVGAGSTSLDFIEEPTLIRDTRALFSGVDLTGGVDNPSGSVTVNTPPVAEDDNAETNEDTAVTVDVLDNDSDSDGDTLSVDSATDGSNGTTVVNGDDTITYTPNANFNGSDSFSYTISDGNGGTDTATVTVTVAPVNDDPVANDDTATTDEDMFVTVSVLVNDTDVDASDTLEVTAVGAASSGTVVFDATSVTYTPNVNFNGTDSFSYTISDGNGGTDTATVTVTVNSVNDLPDAVNDSYETNEDTTLTVNAANGVLANDSDVESVTLSVSTTPIDDVDNGTLTLNADGSFEYTPNANFVGQDTFEYEVSDGDGGTDTAVVTINVLGVNDAPVALADSYLMDEDTTLTVSAVLGVLNNDSDTEGDPLTAVLDTDVSNGTLALEENGGFTYTPNANFNGQDSFTYKANDGTADSNVVTVTIAVQAINDAPVAVDDTETTDEDTSVTVLVLANDTDVDTTDTLEVTAVGTASNGVVTFDASSVTYTPNANFNGTDSFTYTINDGNGGTDTATVNITVNPVGAAFSGSFTIPGRFADNYTAEVVITLYETGTTNQIGTPIITTSNSSGNFTIEDLPLPADGTYDIGVKTVNTLRVIVTATLTIGDNANIDFGALVLGDINNNNQVELGDFSTYSPLFGKQLGDDGYSQAADLSNDGIIDLADFSIFSGNFGLNGDGFTGN